MKLNEKMKGKGFAFQIVSKPIYGNRPLSLIASATLLTARQ